MSICETFHFLFYTLYACTCNYSYHWNLRACSILHMSVHKLGKQQRFFNWVLPTGQTFFSMSNEHSSRTLSSSLVILLHFSSAIIRLMLSSERWLSSMLKDTWFKAWHFALQVPVLLDCIPFVLNILRSSSRLTCL